MYHPIIMGPQIAATFVSVSVALGSRALMKRIAAKRLGRSEDFLLESDFWKATRGDPLRRALLFLELASWAATLALVASVAGKVLA